MFGLCKWDVFSADKHCKLPKFEAALLWKTRPVIVTIQKERERVSTLPVLALLLLL